MPLPPIPYAPGRIYDPTSSGVRIADLIMRQGDIAARGAAASGQIWGNAVQQLGQIGAQAYQQYHQEQEQKKRSAAISQALATWDGDPQSLLKTLTPTIGPEPAMKLALGAATLNKQDQPGKVDWTTAKIRIHAAKTLYEQGGDQVMAQAWPALAPKLQPYATEMGLGQLPAQWDKALLPHLMAADESLNPKEQGKDLTPGSLGWYMSLPPEKRGEALQRMEEFKGAGAKDEKPSVQALDTKTGKPVFITPTQAGDPRYQPMRTGVNVNVAGAGQREEDAQTLADDFRAGRMIPSMLSKRQDYNHILAIASRDAKKEGKPFNPVRMQLDYESSKRFVGSMNGNQMVRFKGLAGSVVNTMDEVKNLAEILKQGGVQKWNQAKRDTIMQVYGNTPQSETAVRYLAAVNTLKEEFANLAQGGFAPTESAWRLAEQQINSNYGVKDFVASVNEAQRLINYRIGAFDELQPTYLGGQGANSPGGNGGQAPARPKGVPSNAVWDPASRRWKL